MKEKRICLNKYHPFKQQWYWYGGEDSSDSGTYCSSCDSYLRFVGSLVKEAMKARPTLYGGQFIHSDPEQVYAIAQDMFVEILSHE